jgi:hypothetical protein
MASFAFAASDELSSRRFWFGFAGQFTAKLFHDPRFVGIGTGSYASVVRWAISPLPPDFRELSEMAEWIGAGSVL